MSSSLQTGPLTYSMPSRWQPWSVVLALPGKAKASDFTLGMLVLERKLFFMRNIKWNCRQAKNIGKRVSSLGWVEGLWNAICCSPAWWSRCTLHFTVPYQNFYLLVLVFLRRRRTLWNTSGLIYIPLPSPSNIRIRTKNNKMLKHQI